MRTREQMRNEGLIDVGGEVVTRRREVEGAESPVGILSLLHVLQTTEKPISPSEKSSFS